MSDEVLAQYRQQLLANVSGEILEIGFGTGLNLVYYPETVQKITTVDANFGMNKIARSRIDRSTIEVNNLVLNGENIPLADETFDSIVTTWTLCSITEVDRAIAEIYRLLKPGGKFLFIEHGISSETKIKNWQNRLTPIQKVIADGCHLNRNIQKIVEKKFHHVNIEQFYVPKLPKISGYMYRGMALK
jgi:ubiquinone/menaquinone biosynthesis C-methylase UbiE